MSAIEIIKQATLRRKIPAHFLAWLILSCISFGSLPMLAQQSAKSSDLVFCPIQKLWVQKYMPRAVVKQPLDEICASDRQKEQFLFEMSKNVPLLRFIHDSVQAEKLFFNYLEKGNRVFAEFAAPQNSPERQLAKLTATQKSTGGSYKASLDIIQTEVFVLAQRLRPPTIRNFALLQPAAFRRLDPITRRIQPRAPPVLL